MRLAAAATSLDAPRACAIKRRQTSGCSAISAAISWPGRLDATDAVTQTVWQPSAASWSEACWLRSTTKNGNRDQQIKGHSEVADHGHCWQKQPKDQQPDIAGKPRRQTPGEEPDVFLSNIGPDVAFVDDIAPEHEEHYGDEQQVRPVQGG